MGKTGLWEEGPVALVMWKRCRLINSSMGTHYPEYNVERVSVDPGKWGWMGVWGGGDG